MREGKNAKKRKRATPAERLKAFFKKIGTLNLILLVVGAFFIWFNGQMLSIFRETGSIPETYACAVIAATIGECGICGWIRTTKDRKKERDWQKEDRREEQQKSETADLE